jgi:hypothetical protein
VSVTEYLRENGSGPYGQWHVPDLVPSSPSVELVFVFESPHVDELRARVPVAGAAGKSALRFLLPGQPKELSLGRFVQQSHAVGDDRIAILNVSNVPMQQAAFVDSEAPDLEEEEWTLIGKVRKSTARSLSSIRATETRAVSQLLAEGLRHRLAGVATGSQARVVAAGAFAQRMVAAAYPDLRPGPLRVPHPSFNHWHQMANQDLPDLIATRDRFRDQSPAGQHSESGHVADASRP